MNQRGLTNRSMNTLQIFFGQFWTVFISATVGVSIAWAFTRRSPRFHPPFVNRKALPELAGRTEDEQRRLLREATLQAFTSWRWLLPVLPLPLAWAVGVGLSHVLPTITSLPDSFWLHAGMATIFGVLGGWLTSRIVNVESAPRLEEAP